MRFGAIPLLCAALALGLTPGAVGPTSAEAGPPAHAGGGKDKGKGGPPDHAGGGGPNRPDSVEDVVRDTVDQTVDDVIESVEDALFGPDQRRVIRDYFEPYRDGREGLPPGLAKRDSLPPGLAKRDTLPPGLQGRGQELPRDLRDRLPTLDERWRRLIFGDDVVIMDTTNDVVVDILKDVF